MSPPATSPRLPASPKPSADIAIPLQTHATSPLLDVQDLCAHFPVRTGLLARPAGVIRAVDGISFSIPRGETLGLVGESGSGKTTVGRCVLRLIPPTSGSVRFDSVDVLAASGPALRALRRRMQIVFQDPAGSLNPRMRIVNIVGEPLLVHGIVRAKDELRARVESLILRCGLTRDALDRYPHQFSGGQRQRVCIARALALHPDLIVCDEPTSALDVSIQAQVLNLLKDLQRELGMSYLFISHDMGVIRHMCDRVAVMLRGKIVELGPIQQVIGAPEHPYTRSLLSAVPVARPPARRTILTA